MEQIDQNNFEKTVLSKPLVNILFYADNVTQCQQIVDFIEELVKQDEFQKTKFFKVDTTKNAEITKQFSVNSVPSLIMFRNGNEIDRVIGADTVAITQKLRKILESERTLQQRLIELINKHPIMIFIKGTPEQPRCGFTRTLINLFNQLNIKYGSFDILSDEEVRQGLKTFSNWPTYPQVYVKGTLIGGLDIIQDLHESGELEKTLQV